jgi:hypothetical protein
MGSASIPISRSSERTIRATFSSAEWSAICRPENFPGTATRCPNTLRHRRRPRAPYRDRRMARTTVPFVAPQAQFIPKYSLTGAARYTIKWSERQPRRLPTSRNRALAKRYLSAPCQRAKLELATDPRIRPQASSPRSNHVWRTQQ